VPHRIIIMKLVHWPRPLLAVPNVTAHPSTASVPIAVLLYNGPLLCGFNHSTVLFSELGGRMLKWKTSTARGHVVLGWMTPLILGYGDITPEIFLRK